MQLEPHGFARRCLPDGSSLWLGRLPPQLVVQGEDFEALWREHPPDFHVVRMFGRPVETPRWQQAYQRDYVYTGSRNDARPLPPSLAPLLAWAQQAIDARLNGVLVNWYDGARGHYIGRHRDSLHGLRSDAPIVTISAGARRVFRLRPRRGAGREDFELENGAVVVYPLATNARWTHEVPASKRLLGRRISVTLRAFEP